MKWDTLKLEPEFNQPNMNFLNCEDAIRDYERLIDGMRALAVDPKATQVQLRAAWDEEWRWRRIRWHPNQRPIYSLRPPEWDKWDQWGSLHHQLDQTRIEQEINANCWIHDELQERLGLLHALFELRRRLDPASVEKEAEVEARGRFYSRETTAHGLVPVHPDSPNWVIEYGTGMFRRPVVEPNQNRYEQGFTIAELRTQVGGTWSKGRTYYKTTMVPIPQGGGLKKWVPCDVRAGYDINCNRGPGVVRSL